MLSAEAAPPGASWCHALIDVVRRSASDTAGAIEACAMSRQLQRKIARADLRPVRGCTTRPDHVLEFAHSRHVA